MLHDSIARFKQSRFIRHLPIILGLSLLPLHFTTYTDHRQLLLLFWGNHLLLASLWYLGSRPEKRSLLLLFTAAAALSGLALIWSLPVAQIGWLVLLSALIGGQNLASPREPLFRLLPVLYLLVLGGYTGLFSMAPQAAPLAVTLALNILGSLALAITMIPQPRKEIEQSAGMGEYAVTTLLFTALLVIWLLVAVSLTTASDLPARLVGSAMAFLALVAVLMANRKQESPSVQAYSNRFRLWMTGTLEALSATRDEQKFINDNMEQLAGLLNLQGLEWQIANQQSALGSRGKTQLRAETPTGYLIATPGPHASDNLVQEIQLALDFLTTLSKFRDQERQLKTQNHLESIYETGARITHDVKNLLQSLNTLTTAVEHSKPEQAEAIQQLIRKQLPLVRQKLQTTLEKLDAPEDISSTFQVARIWWEKLRLRYEPNQIEFISRLETETLIPRDLFERVAENLLENAQRKRQTEPDISISIELIVTQQRITLCVTDSGSPAPEEIAQLLFKGPIDSTSGYGIALYQCAMQAVKQGFQLALSSNERGRVGFSLTGEIS